MGPITAIPGISYIGAAALAVGVYGLLTQNPALGLTGAAVGFANFAQREAHKKMLYGELRRQRGEAGLDPDQPLGFSNTQEAE